MIKGRDFSSQTIANEEKKYIDQFYDSKDTLLSDALAYYGVLFQTFLYRNGDKLFKQMNEKEQQLIIEKEMSRFNTAMMYAFNKGHQTGFALLLMPTSQIYAPDFFEQPDAHEYFIFTFDNMITKDAFEDNLQRDAIDVLIRYTRRHFENGYDEVMNIGRRFFKKGAGVAFEHVREHIVGVDYSIQGYSRMLNAPYNQDFSVTPAFMANFSFESPAFESWDIHWDATYGINASKNLIAKLMVHQFTYKEIKDYADVNTKSYIMLKNYFDNGYDDEELIYLAEMNFLSVEKSNFPRLLENSEYREIRRSVRQTLTRRLGIDGAHLFIVD